MIYSSMKGSNESNKMILNGKGEVTAVPDTAVLRLGVQTTGDNLSVAQSENAAISQSILNSLHQLGITDIKTFQYVINKSYEYEDNKRIDKGYIVRNILEIRMSAMDNIGELIDTAVNNGANVVDLIEFEVSNPDSYYLKALNLAIMNAYEKARSIAESIGAKVNPIPYKINENNLPIFPSRAFGLGEGAAATPIEAGNLQIEASVVVEFIYS